ncbi:hypothetical protein SLS53_003352 [Cytospora paraplurivora]|uniref:Uncharacterized protein n=1 Tax=Cytospora paraplurivora TaxID=2898453 RepID=A0AAN9YGZ3_9PEZI
MNDTISDAGGNSGSSPPSFIWVIIPLVVVLFTGALIAILYRVIMRCRWRKTGGDAEQTAGGLGTTMLEVEDATAWARGHTRQGPALDTSINRSSDRNPSRSATQPPEGLNELGEAPPPYGEGGETQPKSYMVEMDEVRDAGEGPSAPQGSGGQGGLSAGSEPPAYEESAVGGSGGTTTSLREPPAAVVSQPR